MAACEEVLTPKERQEVLADALCKLAEEMMKFDDDNKALQTPTHFTLHQKGEPIRLLEENAALQTKDGAFPILQSVANANYGVGSIGVFKGAQIHLDDVVEDEFPFVCTQTRDGTWLVTLIKGKWSWNWRGPRSPECRGLLVSLYGDEKRQGQPPPQP